MCSWQDVEIQLLILSLWLLTSDLFALWLPYAFSLLPLEMCHIPWFCLKYVYNVFTEQIVEDGRAYLCNAKRCIFIKMLLKKNIYKVIHTVLKISWCWLEFASVSVGEGENYDMLLSYLCYPNPLGYKWVSGPNKLRVGWLCGWCFVWEPIRETSSHTTRQGMFIHSHLVSWVSHCGLMPSQKRVELVVQADLH